MQSNPYDNIQKSFSTRIRRALAHIQEDCTPVFQDFLQKTLKKMDLVSREELHAQTRLLERSLQKLQTLENQLQELQSK